MEPSPHDDPNTPGFDPSRAGYHPAHPYEKEELMWWFSWWMLFVVVLFFFPLGNGWEDRRWGPPYPSFV
jgi:hypothetical protein